MFQKMDMQEFDRLYAEYKPRFVLIACSYLRDRAQAEDLVTDCFMHCWERRQEIGSITENIPAYLLGIIRHKCIDALRAKQQHLQTHQQIYQIGLRNIRENLAALVECDLAKTLFRAEVEEIFRRRLSGDAGDFRRGSSWPAGSRSGPTRRSPRSTRFRSGRSRGDPTLPETAARRDLGLTCRLPRCCSRTFSTNRSAAKRSELEPPGLSPRAATSGLTPPVPPASHNDGSGRNHPPAPGTTIGGPEPARSLFFRPVLRLSVFGPQPILRPFCGRSAFSRSSVRNLLSGLFRCFSTFPDPCGKSDRSLRNSAQTM